MKKLFFFLFLFIILITNFLFSIVQVVQVYPLKQEVVASNGDKVIGNIWVFNPTQETLEIKIMPEDWTAGKHSKEVTWLKITKPKKLKFILKPGETKEVKYKGVIPKDAKGTLTAQIFFTSLPKKEKVFLGTRIASGLFITIKNTEVVDVKIETFDFSIKEDKSLDFVITIKNDGNIRLNIDEGKFEIRDIYGETKFEHSFNKWVLPAGEKWNFYVGRNEKIVLPEGNYKAKVRFLLNNQVLEKPVVVEEDKDISVVY